MPIRAYVIIAVRLIVLAGMVWFVSVLVRSGLPLQWVATFFGGIFVLTSAAGLVFNPVIYRAFPQYEERAAAVVGYRLPRRVQTALMIAYLVLGGAALAWGLSTNP
ncbi:MAG: hypothetical protein M3Q74_01540 [Pseudomonadota bacterium]|nr:hypothetical protein [Pseudomonadota bacterium]